MARGGVRLERGDLGMYVERGRVIGGGCGLGGFGEVVRSSRNTSLIGDVKLEGVVCEGTFEWARIFTYAGSSRIAFLSWATGDEEWYVELSAGFCVEDIVVGLDEIVSLISGRPANDSFSTGRLLFVLVVTALTLRALMISARMAVRWGGNGFERK